MNLEPARLPRVIIMALVSMLLAVALSFGAAFIFPWHGPTAQQEQAAPPALLAVGLVFLCSVVGLILAGRGIAESPPNESGPSRGRLVSLAVFGLALVVVIAAGLQGCAYMFSFAFIGG
jgi:hypothetical protein